MGSSGSKLEKALGDQFPEGERYFGLENFGNIARGLLHFLEPEDFLIWGGLVSLMGQDSSLLVSTNSRSVHSRKSRSGSESMATDENWWASITCIGVEGFGFLS